MCISGPLWIFICTSPAQGPCPRLFMLSEALAHSFTSWHLPWVLYLVHCFLLCPLLQNGLTIPIFFSLFSYDSVWTSFSASLQLSANLSHSEKPFMYRETFQVHISCSELWFTVTVLWGFWLLLLFFFLILSNPFPSPPFPFYFFSSFIYPVFHISFLYSIQAPGQMFHWRTPWSPLCFYKPVDLHSWRLLIPDDLAAVATEITDPSHGNTSFFDHSQTQQGSWFFKAGHTGNSW